MQQLLLPVRYLHVVFTVPHSLVPLFATQPRLLYNLLFQAARQTLLELTADPAVLGAQPAVVMVLHSWGQLLLLHPHIHCLLSIGGLSLDRRRWITPGREDSLPRALLARTFRQRFLEGLERLYRRGELLLEGELAELANPEKFASFIQSHQKIEWVVDSQAPPAHSQDSQAAVNYLTNYVVGSPVSDARILSADGQNVTRVALGAGPPDPAPRLTEGLPASAAEQPPARDVSSRRPETYRSA